METQQKKFTEEEVEQLLDLYLKKFVDIPKILGALDSELAESFKKRNSYAFQALHEAGKIHHDHGHSETDMCEEMHSTIFIQPEDQNTVEKLISEEIYRPRFKLNLKQILSDTFDAYTKITEKIKLKVAQGEGPGDVIPKLPGMPKVDYNQGVTDDDNKLIMKKIAYESTNRFIRMNVKEKLLEKEKSYAQQPMLLAYPSGAPKNADLRQLDSTNIEHFMDKGW